MNCSKKNNQKCDCGSSKNRKILYVTCEEIGGKKTKYNTTECNLKKNKK